MSDQPQENPVIGTIGQIEGFLESEKNFFRSVKTGLKIGEEGLIRAVCEDLGNLPPGSTLLSAWAKISNNMSATRRYMGGE